MRFRGVLVLRLATVAWMVAGAIDQARADVVTTNSIAETTLETNNNNRNRANDFLVVGNTGGPGRRHGLVMFTDIAALLGPGTINSVTLSLRAETITTPAPADQLGIFRVTTAWTEGVGSAAEVNTGFGATWNSAKREGADGIGEGDPGDTDGPTQWTNAGGDFVGTTGVQATNPYATGVLNGNFYTFDVTALVQGWYDGSITNLGLMVTPLTPTGTIFSRVAFRTSDQASPPGSGSFPHLDIDFTPVPEAGAWALVAVAAALGGAGLWLRRGSSSDWTSPFGVAGRRLRRHGQAIHMPTRTRASHASGALRCGGPSRRG